MCFTQELWINDCLSQHGPKVRVERWDVNCKLSESESESESLCCHCTKCNDIGVEALKISAFKKKKVKQKQNQKRDIFKKYRMLKNSKTNIYILNFKGEIGKIMQSFIILHYLEK